jgi:hypothetical protein
VSLIVIVAILGASIVASILVRPNSTTKNPMDTKKE